MEATVLSFSKPLHVSSPQAHKPTILNLHPNNASILNSSFYGESFQMLRGEMSIRDCSWMPSLGGAGPEIVAFKGPLTGRRLVGKNRRVPSWRSLTLESLRGGTASLEVLLDAKKARLDPQFLDDAESKFQTILSQDPIQFHELKVPMHAYFTCSCIFVHSVCILIEWEVILCSQRPAISPV